mgnify:CR=1 FL=1
MTNTLLDGKILASDSERNLISRVDESVHGILLQHPVPKQIDERKCFNHIDVAKDVDGVTTLGFGNMTMGVNAYGSCTPQGIIRILEHYNIELSGLNAVIVGRLSLIHI